MTKNERAEQIASLSDSAAQFRELVSCNGTVQNMATRRMTASQIDSLGEYAATRPPDPFSTKNTIQLLVAKAKRS